VNGQIKYIVFGAFAVANVIIGSLLFALATDNYGVGVAIAVIATYLAKSD